MSDFVTIQFHSGNVLLCVYVTEHLFSDGSNSGYIEIHDGRLGTKPVFWDNLSYFFEIDKAKKKELKKELKEKGQFYSGVISDIKRSVKKAIKLGYLK